MKISVITVKIISHQVIKISVITVKIISHQVIKISVITVKIISHQVIKISVIKSSKYQSSQLKLWIILKTQTLYSFVPTRPQKQADPLVPVWPWQCPTIESVCLLPLAIFEDVTVLGRRVSSITSSFVKLVKAEYGGWCSGVLSP